MRRPRGASAQDVLDVVDLALRAHGALQKVGDEVAAAHDQTGARLLVLGALARETGSIADVARRRGLRRQSVQETMGRLERQGLVARTSDGSLRSPRFVVTDVGRSVHASAERDVTDWAAAVATRLTAAEMAHALRVLQVLADR